MRSQWRDWSNDPTAVQALSGMAPDEREELRELVDRKKATTGDERLALIAEAIATARSRREAAARARGDIPTTPEERDELMAAMAEAQEGERSRMTLREAVAAVDAEAARTGERLTSHERADRVHALRRGEQGQDIKHAQSNKEQETKACPWCGETILAVAKKCKHCGEYLEDEPSQVPEPRGRGWTLSRGAWVCLEHGRSDCTTCTGKTEPVPSRPATHTDSRIASGSTRNQPISQAGRKTEAGLACPECGGTQFKAKRSGKAKLGAVALTPLVLAKAGQVKCVTCGAIYKRG